MSVRRDFRAPAARWSLSEAIPALLFRAFLLLVLLNLNGLWYLLFFEEGQTYQRRIPWMLTGLCALALALTVRAPIHKSLGLPGFLFLGTLISYLGISTPPYIWNMAADQVPITLLLQYVIYFVVVVVTAAATTAIIPRVGVVRFLRWILVVLTLGCVSILATPWLTGENVLVAFGTRMYGVYMQPNEAGLFANMTMWLAIALILCKRNRILAITAMVVAGAAILLSASRSAVLTALIFMILFLAYSIVLRIKIMTTAITLSAVAALIAGLMWLVLRSEPILAMALPMPEKLTSLFTLMSGDVSLVTTDARWTLLLQALNEIEAAPLVGNGFRHPLPDILYCFGDGSRCSAHNLYLTLWVEAGFVPVVLYLGYVLSMLGTSLGLPQRVATVTAVGWTVARAVQDLFSDNGYEILWLGCFSGLAFGLLMHEVHRYRDRNGSEHPGDSYGGDPSASPGSARSVP